MTINHKKIRVIIKCKKCGFTKYLADTLYWNTCSGNCWFAWDSKVNKIILNHDNENGSEGGHIEFYISSTSEYLKKGVTIRTRY